MLTKVNIREAVRKAQGARRTTPWQALTATHRRLRRQDRNTQEGPAPELRHADGANEIQDVKAGQVGRLCGASPHA